MPWTEELPSGKVRAVWRDHIGKRHSKSGFTQTAAALRYAGEQEIKSRRGEASTAGRSPKWAHWCEDWLALRNVERSTMREDRIRIDKHIMPKWGSARIARIEREHVQAWVNDMTRSGMSPGLVRRVYHTFSASMKAAMIYKRIPANPCSHIELPTPPPAQERYFTRAEFDAALRLMREPYRTAAILLVATGMRFSELAGLHWHRVDFETGKVLVCETFEADYREIKPYPKSKRPRTVGPLPSWALDALRDRLDAVGDLRDGCGMTHAGSRATCRHGLVLTDANGKPLDKKLMLRRHWKPALLKAGVESGRTHDIRHTFASWLRQNGVDLEIVQGLLGHASIVTTQRYSHHGDTADSGIQSALEGQMVGQADSAPSVPLDLESVPEATAS